MEKKNRATTDRLILVSLDTAWVSDPIFSPRLMMWSMLQLHITINRINDVTIVATRDRNTGTVVTETFIGDSRYAFHDCLHEWGTR
jgi:hypothetical protein